jgi:hypothetical protein
MREGLYPERSDLPAEPVAIFRARSWRTEPGPQSRRRGRRVRPRPKDFFGPPARRSGAPFFRSDPLAL